MSVDTLQQENMVLLRKRRRGPNYAPKIVDAAQRIYLEGARPRQIVDDLKARFPDETETLTERTISNWIRGWRRDRSGPWALLADDERADATLLLPLLAELITATQGRVLSLTNDEARTLTLLCRAVPDMPALGKYSWTRAFNAARETDPLGPYVHYLSFAPWRDRGVDYIKAWKEGFIEDLRSFSPGDEEWLPSGVSRKRGSFGVAAVIARPDAPQPNKRRRARGATSRAE